MIHTEDMLKEFAKYRGDAIVIPGRGGRHWHGITDKPSFTKVVSAKKLYHYDSLERLEKAAL